MSDIPKIHAPLTAIPAGIACARDYEALAPNFVPPDRFAYIAGGSGHDVTLARNSQAFEGYAIRPSVFADLTKASTALELFGEQFCHPFLLAPVAYQTLVHPQGELATAQAAEATDTCMVASNLSSYSLESIAEQKRGAHWFQLYMQPDPAATSQLVQRAHAAGYGAIMVTVDAAVQVPSVRALRAGFRFPQDISSANFEQQEKVAPPRPSKTGVFETFREHAVTRKSLAQVIADSSMPVLVKGVLNPEDAEQLMAMGVAGLVVSNHGGRTLDGVPASLSVLPAIRQRVGPSFPLLFDGGIRSGNDAFVAMALGANAILIGRLQMYALAVAGALGVAHMLKLLREEFELAMAISGSSCLADITPSRLFPLHAAS